MEQYWCKREIENDCLRETLSPTEVSTFEHSKQPEPVSAAESQLLSNK